MRILFFLSKKINKRWGLVEWCELGKMGEMMKLGDGKRAKKQTGERTVKTRKAGVTKRQGWEQGKRTN